MSRRTEQYLMLERRNKVVDLYLKGATQSRIAEQLGVTQQCISRDLKEIRRQWVDEMLTDFDEIKARELQKIDNLEEQCWAAWERSCQNAETITVEEKQALRAEAEEEVATGLAAKIKSPQVLTVVEKVTKNQSKAQAGDPRFLERIAWCIEQRVKIFGIIKTDKQAGVTLVNINWGALKDRAPLEDPVAMKILQSQGASDG